MVKWCGALWRLLAALLALSSEGSAADARPEESLLLQSSVKPQRHGMKAGSLAHIAEENRGTIDAVSAHQDSLSIDSGLPDILDISRRWHNGGLVQQRRSELMGNRHTAPLLVVSRGCSGSSAMRHHLLGLLKLAGVQTFTGEQWESTKKSKNPFYKSSEGIAQAMEGMARAAASRNATLVFKSRPDFISGKLASVLVALGTRAIVYWRDNVLDHYVCKVQNCFNPQLDGSYPVDEHGKKSNLCFAHRHSDTKTFANLNTAHLLKILDYEQGLARDYVEAMIQKGFNLTAADIYSFDTLYAYENRSMDLQMSATAWKGIMVSYGVGLDVAAIVQFLRPSAGSRPFPKHRETIYNLEAVRKVLAAGDGKFLSLLRN